MFKRKRGGCAAPFFVGPPPGRRPAVSGTPRRALDSGPQRFARRRCPRKAGRGLSGPCLSSLPAATGARNGPHSSHNLPPSGPLPRSALKSLRRPASSGVSSNSLSVIASSSLVPALDAWATSKTAGISYRISAGSPNHDFTFSLSVLLPVVSCFPRAASGVFPVLRLSRRAAVHGLAVRGVRRSPATRPCSRNCRTVNPRLLVSAPGPGKAAAPRTAGFRRPRLAVVLDLRLALAVPHNASRVSPRNQRLARAEGRRPSRATPTGQSSRACQRRSPRQQRLVRQRFENR